MRSSTAKSFVSEISDPCSCKSPPGPGRCRKYVGQTYPFSTANPKNLTLSARAGGEKCNGKTAIQNAARCKEGQGRWQEGARKVEDGARKVEEGIASEGKYDGLF